MSLQKIDHIIYGVHKLEDGVKHLENLLGIEVSPGGRHPAFGTINAIFRIAAHSYFEIIAPDPEKDPKIDAEIFGLNQMKEHRLIGWMIKEQHIPQKLITLKSLRIPVGEVITGQRIKSTGDVLQWKLTDPLRSMENGIIPFLIDWEDSEHPSSSMDMQCQLVDFGVYHPNANRIKSVFNALELNTVVLQSPTIGFEAKISSPNGLITLH